jgi:dUTP pyrophosphatase
MKSVKIKLLHPNAQIPKKIINTDACYDVVATSKEILGDGRIKYGLGFALEIPDYTQFDLRPRSSIHKTGLILSNCIGTGDEEYRGEYMAYFYHIIPTLPPYEIGDRILQVQLRDREDINFIETQELSDTERGTNGFGSTNKKLVGIIASSIDDFIKCLVEMQIHNVKTRNGSARHVIASNGDEYFCITKAHHVIGFRLNDVIVTEAGYKNPEFDKIVECIRPIIVNISDDKLVEIKKKLRIE